jgi:hypothetical protein
VGFGVESEGVDCGGGVGDVGVGLGLGASPRGSAVMYRPGVGVVVAVEVVVQAGFGVVVLAGEA